jgi:hypothetical protein
MSIVSKTGTLLSLFYAEKKKHFQDVNRPTRVFKTCQRCRDNEMARVRTERDAANAAGLRWCITGKHRVTAAACTSTGGVIRASCLACRKKQNEAYAAHVAALVIDQNAEQDAIDDREAVAVEPISDDEFGDDTEWMTADLPGDSAVSPREKTLLQNVRQHLADIKVHECSTCCERGFDIKHRNESTECQRCQADKHHEGKLWSNANNVNPCTFPLIPLVGRHRRWFVCAISNRRNDCDWTS